MPARRARIAVLFALCLTLLAPGALPARAVPADRQESGTETSDGRPLRAHALDRGVYIGTMIATIADRYRAEEAAGKQVLTYACSEFNMMTPGNALKFNVVHPVEGTYDWWPAEHLFALSAQCGMRVVGNALVWHEQLPKWVLAYDGQREKLRTILRKHVQAVVRHFAGRVAVWDVVNEAVLPNGRLRDTFWLRNLGPRYVVDAFKWARQADATAKLYYNDYGSEGLNSKSDAVYGWVQEWLRQKAPIDGVGMQMHTDIYGPNWRQITTNMRRLAKLGLATRLSEMDVAVHAPVGAGRLQAQGWVYYNAARACFSKGTNCRMLTVWGLTDKYWTPTHRIAGHCCGVLLDEDYRRKPAYYGLVAGIDAAEG